MKARTAGTRPAAQAPRKGWTQMRSGAVAYGWITAEETEISAAMARGLTRNLAIMDPWLHEQTQEIMSLAT